MQMLMHSVGCLSVACRLPVGCLSVACRLPVGTDPDFDGEERGEDSDIVCAIQVVSLQVMPADAASLATESAKEPLISAVMRYTREGWPQEKKQDEGADMSRLRALMNSLSVSNGCLLHGNRVVIPTRLRPQVLKLLHTGHFGMVRLKQLARTAVYWPNIDKHIEAMGRNCTSSGEHQSKPQKPAVHP